MGNFALAKKELKKIKESDANYRNAKLLIAKIDSSCFQQAFESYSNRNFEEATYLLNDIDSNSSWFKNKENLLKEISNKKDSVVYQVAFEQYSKNHLVRANETLEKIGADSQYQQKKEVLSEQILKKIKHNSIKEKYISKAVISSIFGPSPSIMKVKDEKPGVFIVGYYSREAGKSYSYQVKFENNKAYWGADDGRWRYDDISYTESNDAYYITEVYSDGSSRKDKFYKKILR